MSESKEKFVAFSKEPPQIADIVLESIPGLGEKTANIFREGGYHTITDIMNGNLIDFEILGISRNTAKKIRKEIMSLYPEAFPKFEEEYTLEDIPGVGPATANAMRERGLNINLLRTTPIRELEERYGIGSESAIKLKKRLAEELRGGWFTDALTCFESQRKSNTITFGVDCLDDLLAVSELGNRGVRVGQTYELFGSFRSGKSQICHQLCVTVQLPREKGGLGKKAIYIDTEGTFSPTRIMQMAEMIKRDRKWDEPVQNILKNVMVARATTTDEQQQIVEKLLEILGKEPDQYGILVVDSVTALFRSEYAGRGSLAERQQTLNYHLSILTRIAVSYGLSIVVTNQVQANPAQFFGDPTNPIGGNIVAHWANTRLFLRKSKAEKRSIRIYDSPVLEERETLFSITEEGLMDACR